MGRMLYEVHTTETISHLKHDRHGRRVIVWSLVQKYLQPGATADERYWPITSNSASCILRGLFESLSRPGGEPSKGSHGMRTWDRYIKL